MYVLVPLFQRHVIQNPGSQSFFTIYRNLFDRLAYDEKPYVDMAFPSFGDSTWPWAPPSKTEQEKAARTFYNFWLNFLTNKDFNWAEQWNISEAPDRRVRRYAKVSPYGIVLMMTHFCIG